MATVLVLLFLLLGFVVLVTYLGMIVVASEEAGDKGRSRLFAVLLVLIWGPLGLIVVLLLSDRSEPPAQWDDDGGPLTPFEGDDGGYNPRWLSRPYVRGGDE